MAKQEKRTDAGMDTKSRSERSEEATQAAVEATRDSVAATDEMKKATDASIAATEAQQRSTHTVKIVYVLAVVVIAAIGAFAAVFAPEQAVAILAFCGSIIVALIPLMKGQSEVHATVNSKMDLLLETRERAKLAEGEAIGRQLQKEEHEEKTEGDKQ